MIWSHTFLETYNQCPRKWHHYYVLRDIKREQTEAMEKGKDIHGQLDDWIKAGALAAAGLTVKSEVKLGIRENGTACDFYADDVWGRGVVDVLITGSSNTTGLLYDWKTGKRREDPTELQLHGVLAKAHWPELEPMYGSYIWLKEGKIGPRHKLESATKLQRIRDTMDDIGHQLKMGYCPPKQSPLCQWCQVKSCEFHP